jgi:hypothetical protein
MLLVSLSQTEKVTALGLSTTRYKRKDDVNVKLHTLFASGMDGCGTESGSGTDVVTNRKKKYIYAFGIYTVDQYGSKLNSLHNI